MEQKTKPQRAAMTLTALVAGAFAACAAGTSLAAPQQPADIPAEAFFDFPDIASAVMSPSGKQLAVLVRGHDGRRELAVLDTSDPAKMRIVASFAVRDVERPHWVNDHRLLFSSAEERNAADENYTVGTFAVDADGTHLREIIGGGQNTLTVRAVERHLGWDYAFDRTLRDGSDDIVVEKVISRLEGGRGHYHAELQDTVPMRVNTSTGQVTPLVPPPVPDHVQKWLIDDQGKVLGGLATVGDLTTLYAPDTQSGRLEKVGSSPTYHGPGSFSVVDVGADGRVYVTVDGATGFEELRRLDMKTGKPEAEAVLKLDGFDFAGTLRNDSAAHRVAGIDYDTDAAGTAWFDPAAAALQQKVDAKLRGRVNLVSGANEHALVVSYSDRQPPEYYLYDRTADRLTPIGQSRPAIDARLMAREEFTRIKARDGHDLPVWITKPLGKGPWPTVVLVHGGPYLRGWRWEWDGAAQFLASRGYLVVKPEFRGSAGYGDALFLPGFKQWGLAMQDDIADATTWAAKQGLADAQRTCIMGGSYGGYAALMGLVRYGDLYRCGIASSAVSDIGLMYDTWWDDAGSSWKHYGMPLMVGDPDKDAAQFAATSPLKQAARITRPLLLAHGGVDRRVPVEHAQALRDALLANHAPVTWLYYPHEGHGIHSPADRAAYYRAVQDFLDKHIGAAAQAK